MKNLFLALVLFLMINSSMHAQKQLPDLLLRVDDIGMNHSVNMAFQQLAEIGIPFSASVMFTCPWHQQAVDLLKKYPHVSVGVHLTLNAEWKYYRWGPVLGKEAVPSLVAADGYFHPSGTGFLNSGYKLDEVERELTAQIEIALASGLQIDYIDHHMGTAVATPQLRALVEKLAKKYQLAISRYYQEEYHTMFDVPIDRKHADFIHHISNNLKPGKTNLVVLHIAQETPEMNALIDLNFPGMTSADGKSEVSKHRQAELNMLLSPDFKKLIDKKFKMVTYRDLNKTKGLSSLVAPN
jgi:chitin disaccharide deacetylase